ncbi:hypothetical protein G4B88_029374 [Cannabis sativa]|uniref:Uncharacterized protein n=1 Tax=Cannabis sativa TaxID=3483 RepID=A0A7J6G1T4_CANSA|nr:hypothetical protein G4B88_029374 [Cannabis sativa]
MAVHLEKLLLSINGNSSNSNDKISCVVSDVYMGIGMEVAAKMGIEGNSPNQNQIIQLSSGMPSANTSKLPWKDQDLVGQKYGFQVHFKAYECAKTAHWCLFNTTCDIESVALSLFPKFLPIGPLIANRANRLLDISQSQFWANDSSCISWLNQQKDCSVIYIAFGSFTIHEQHQFYELAHGLKLTRRPFLWVVRPGFISSEKAKSTMFDPLHTFLGIENMVGKIVSWAPQQEVLSHPAIACFVTHCGWNSTMEGLSNGVPFLCWPYFSDQFMNKDYICDFWKVGMEFVADEKGIITKEEVKDKVDKLLNDVEIRKRSMQFKELAMKNIAEDGQSSKNFNYFIKWLESL